MRIAVETASCIAAVVYRPGSAAVSSQFFAVLGDLMDRLATFVDPTLLLGDINIRLDRSTDPLTVQLVDMLTSHGFTNRVTSATHNLGGLLDVVVTRDDLLPPSVDVLDVGLSDHHLLRWQAPLVRPPPVYKPVTSRPWNRLVTTKFRSQLLQSSLCCPDSWCDMTVDELATSYDDVMTTILDQLIPVRTMTCRRRVSDPWFDDDCRVAKRTVRLFERDVRRADPRTKAAATDRWYKRRREYHQLLREKRETFWRTKVNLEQSAPRQLWRSVNSLMGRGRAAASAPINAEEMHRFFDNKVAGVRASTADAPPPSYSTAPPDRQFNDFRAFTVADVTAAVRLLPDKQCSSDPLPTSLLKVLMYWIHSSPNCLTGPSHPASFLLCSSLHTSHHS
jgi:hypothetical protein